MIIKFLVLTIGSLLLVRLYFIASGIPVSIIAYNTTYTDNDYEGIINNNPQHAYAYEKRIQPALDRNDLKMAKHYSHKTLQNNLTNGDALSQLIVINNAQKNQQRANEAATFSTELWPAHALSMLRVGTHWLQQKQYKKMLDAYNVTLTQYYNNQNVSVFKEKERLIFSIYEQAALENIQQNTEDIFTAYHKTPPIWWMHYFRYLTNHSDIPEKFKAYIKKTTPANNLKVVNQFYKQSVSYNQQFPAMQRKLLLERQGEAHDLREAYYLWLESLDKQALKKVQILYNGDFEGNVLNEGFSWIFGNMSNVHVYRDSISHLSGKYSLHIAFNEWVTNYFGYFHQPLILSARKYTLNFNIRSNLSTEKGLVWKVYCINSLRYLNEKMGKKIATSEPFIGDLKWQKKTFTFTIPNTTTCPAQGLFLDTITGSEEERRVRGDIWFDDMELVPEN